MCMREYLPLDSAGRLVNIRRWRGSSAGDRHPVPRLLADPPFSSLAMMMAYDSGLTPPSRLDDASIDVLRAALRDYLQDSQDPSKLQPSLLLIANEARARSILPEQLLVVLKEVWSSLPEVRSMTNTREQINLLQRVVTMCIKEYYSA